MSLKNLLLASLIVALGACTKDKDKTGTQTQAGGETYEVENTYSKAGALADLHMQKTQQKNGSIVARAILAKPSQEDLQFKWIGRKGSTTEELHSGTLKAGNKMVSYKPNNDWDFITVEIFGFKDGVKYGNIKTLTLNPNAKVVMKAQTEVQETKTMAEESTETAEAEAKAMDTAPAEKERMQIDPNKVKVQQ